MIPAQSERIQESLHNALQVWNGHLWSPDWFRDGDLEIGCGELLSLLDAGADAVSTNTFGATASVLASYGEGRSAFEVNLAAASLAKRAADAYSTPERQRWVIGSIGPTLRPLSLMGGTKKDTDQLRQDYLQQMDALLQGQVDLLHIEMCQDCLNALTALEATQTLEAKYGKRLPFMITAGIEATGKMLDGHGVDFLWKIAGRYTPLLFGVSANLEVFTGVIKQVLETVQSPIAALIHTFAVGSEKGWVGSPPVLAMRLAELASRARLSVIGVGLGANAEYVKSIAAMLGPPRISTH